MTVLFAYAGLITGCLIYFDGRYRDFPIILFALPVLQMATSGYVRQYATNQRWLTHALPSVLAVMFALLIIEKEVENNAACIWLGLSILMAFANWPIQQHKLVGSTLGQA